MASIEATDATPVWWSTKPGVVRLAVGRAWVVPASEWVAMVLAGYAVVDVETTGLFTGRHGRIAEVGVVHLSRDGVITNEWCTLVNPGRDLGPQHIHGITASDARLAPTFADVAGDLAVWLAGRVVVAHNLTFDVRFLAAEYLRLGVEVPLSRDRGLCTMELAGRYLDSPRRSLAACCAAAGIDHSVEHSALHDARAAAGLLAQIVRSVARPEPWHDVLTSAKRHRWPVLAGCGRTRRRSAAATRPASFLARMIDRLPRVQEPPRANEYLALLDRALLDRHLSASEQDALFAVAESLALSFATTMELHRSYLSALAEAAWQDEVVTDEEHKDLVEVADLLGLARQDVDIALRDAQGRQTTARWGQFRLKPGDVVAFTGQMNDQRDEWEARATTAGLSVMGAGVTRRTRLLVAADPDSMSGKADTARRYGIPIVTVDAFAKLLDEMQGERRR